MIPENFVQLQHNHLKWLVSTGSPYPHYRLRPNLKPIFGDSLNLDDVSYYFTDNDIKLSNKGHIFIIDKEYYEVIDKNVKLNEYYNSLTDKAK